MMRPTARVGLYRRRAYLYGPLVILGAALVLMSSGTVNGAYLAGLLIILAGAGGFVLESGPQPGRRR
ncbi:hypothetical protein [Arthrobacter sp. fls2-241-R2A-172]|uniref:hypothetical protein n=1 Tax=Arthrobacter sp. fls2-241-R2A-172 TaxID=3040325 RepID=UPI0025516546|nr:hypothetical protein [Arthrobacter sp. fls2-241-R2A-172]